MKELIEKLPSAYDKRAWPIKHVYCPVTSMIYFQTDPFVRDGKVIIKRLGAVKVEIEQSTQIVEEIERKELYDR